MSESRSYARVAPVRSTSSLKESASATRRWTHEETRARATAGPQFRLPGPDRSLLDALVAGYERITVSTVRRPAQRNLIAACYRVHGEDFLRLVEETFARTGTTTNLLGELRVLQAGDSAPVALTATTVMITDFSNGHVDVTRQAAQEIEPPDRPATKSLADGVSAWCGCCEEELRPDLLYCSAHYRYGYAGKLRLDRRESNPAAARFLAANHTAPVEP